MATMEFKTEDGNTQIFDRVIEARVQIFHGAEEAIGEVRMVPSMQFVVRIPFDAFINMAKWALAPAGKPRFANVTLDLSDRSREITHKMDFEESLCLSL